jgi:hypothetical protein
MNPDYDSGWVDLPIRSSITLTHNLGTRDLYVYMIGRFGDDTHNHAVGGDYWYDTSISEYRGRGAYWYTEGVNSMKIHHYRGDERFAYNWGEVRVLAWKLPPKIVKTPVT